MPPKVSGDLASTLPSRGADLMIFDYQLRSDFADILEDIKIKCCR